MTGAHALPPPPDFCQWDVDWPSGNPALNTLPRSASHVAGEVVFGGSISMWNAFLVIPQASFKLSHLE